MEQQHLRCPFCHDVLPADSPERVVCTGCAAEHHAECFAEHGSCAATACTSKTVAVGNVELDVLSLQEVAGDRERLAELAASKPPKPRSVLLALLKGVIALLGYPVAGYLAPEFGMLVWTFVVLLMVPTEAFGRSARHRVNLREPESFDPIFGMWRSGNWTPGAMPDHTEFMRERLAEAGSPTPSGPAVTPEECPSCEQPLEVDDGDEELTFCYHCGGDLNPLPEDLEGPVTPNRELA
jgi:hypothetical protein